MKLLIGLVAIVVCAPALGAEGLVRARLLADVGAVEPGGEFTVGVFFEVKPEWHIYWMNPGDSGIATTVEFGLPEGYEVGELRWPTPKRFESSGLVMYGYEKELLLTAKVRAPKGAKAGETVQIKAKTDWLSCKEECIPGGVELSLTLPVKGKAEPANRELFEAWAGRLPVSHDTKGSPLKVEKNGVGELRLAWKEAVKGVEFYPATTKALDLTQVEVVHENKETRVGFTPLVYDAAGVANGQSRGLVVYQSPTGERRGVWVPVTVR